MTDVTREDVRRTGFAGVFRLDTWRGRVAVANGIVLLVTPALATFVSPWFLLVLAVTFALSLFSVYGLVQHRQEEPRGLQLAGQTLAINAVILIVAMFSTGIAGDFVLADTGHPLSEAVTTGFTAVHLLFGTGLILSDLPVGRRRRTS